MNPKKSHRWTFERAIRSAVGIVGLLASLYTPFAVAQTATDLPQVISPLQAAKDHNGVNVLNGKNRVGLPRISVPGAPRLTFERIQDVTLYINAKVTSAGGLLSLTENDSAHIGGDRSVSFRCADGDCVSVGGDGSSLVPLGNSRIVVMGGSGEKYLFNVLQVKTTGTYPTARYYASQVQYPDGEVISYTYDSAAVAGNPATFRRPNTVSSNVGYYLSITYQSNDVSTGSLWSSPAQVTLYNASSPSTPLARLTYGTNTITDIGGRVFQGNISNNMAAPIEVVPAQFTLPGESTPTLTQNSNAINRIGSVVRDGVTWNYSYANPVYWLASNEYTYTSLTVTGPDAYSATYTFDPYYGLNSYPSNRLRSVVDALGRATQYGYQDWKLTQITAPEGNNVQITYDDFGNITQKTTVPKAGSGLANLTETASFNTVNCVAPVVPTCYRPVWLRDALGRQTDYLYDTNGQVTEVTAPADASGVRRKIYTTYDTAAAPYRKRVVRVCGLTTTCGTTQEARTEYDYWGSTFLPLAVRQVDAATGTTLQTQYTYDLAGRVLVADGPLAGTDDASYNRYDVYGRKTWEIGPLGANSYRVAKRYTYRDSDDRVIATESGYVTDPNATTLNTVTRVDTSYDTRRNPVRDVLSATGVTYQVADKSYNGRGAVVCQTTRMNSASFSALPTDACTLTLTPPTCTDATAENSSGDDRITRNVYDNAGQLTTVQRAYGTCLQEDYATYTYSNNGKQKTVTDARGYLSSMTYDGFDRLKQLNFPSPTVTGVASSTDYETYGYNAVGNRTSFRKRDGSVLTYQFDNLNRMIVKTVPERTGLAATNTRDVYYGYDIRGPQTSVRFDGASGEGISNTYDGYIRLASSTLAMDGASRALGYQYDAHSNRARLTFPDGNYATYEFDAADRPAYIRRSGSSQIAHYSYAPTGWRSNFDGGLNTSYGYDAIGRVSTLTNNMPASAYNNQWTFGYNSASQITQTTRSNDAFAWTDAANADRNYVPNGLNQYTAVGAASYCYDANGNLTADGTNVYLYDVENRLVEKRSQTSTACPTSTSGYGGTLQARLRYDPAGRLYELVDGAGVTARYLYDGDALVAEYDGAGTLLRRYVHGADAVADDPIAWYEGAAFGSSNERFMRPDWEGSISIVSDSVGSTALAVNRYDEYGNPQSTNAGRFQYTGQAWLPALGMYYYKARIYSPMLGRFLQTDPIGTKDDLNLYTYVGNDPLDRTDPSGLKCQGTGEDASCTFDEFKDKKGNVITREQATSGGNRLTKALKMDPASRVARQEAAMTAKYKGALAMQERGGSVTISGNKSLGVADQTVSGGGIVSAMQSTPLVSTGKSGPSSSVLAGTVKVGATGQVLRIEFYNNGAGASDFGQLFGHEELHSAYQRPSATDAGWDNPNFGEQHQVPFNNASDQINK
ncbi:MAG: RHS repeat-associated core domain-containing protein [Steroidobacteraceae bacterium]